MKVLIFGNLASGKSYLVHKVIKAVLDAELLAVDEFRKKLGDGTMEKEIEAKRAFLNSIKQGKFQIIEATGLGDTGEAIAEILKGSKEFKLIIILRTPLEICLERLSKRVWEVPYPAPPEKAFSQAEEIEMMLSENAIHKLWINTVNHKIIELRNVSEEEFSRLIEIINYEYTKTG